MFTAYCHRWRNKCAFFQNFTTELTHLLLISGVYCKIAFFEKCLQRKNPPETCIKSKFHGKLKFEKNWKKIKK